MSEQNDTIAKHSAAAMSAGPSLHVCFMPSRDISLKALVGGLLFSEVYSTAATILFIYTLFHTHGAWFYVALALQLILHFYLTTELLISRDEVERLAGYGVMRREGVVRFCGYAPQRRRLRTGGMPILSIEEVNSEVRIHLSDGSRVQLPKLSLEGQRLFKRVFESISSGADTAVLKARHPELAPGILVSLEYKEAPQLPKWRYWISLALVLPGFYVGWKLYGLLF